MERTLEDLKTRLTRAVKDPMQVLEIAVAALGSPTKAYNLVLGSTGDKQLAQDWRGVLLLHRDHEKYGANLREILMSLFSRVEHNESSQEKQVKQGRKMRTEGPREGAIRQIVNLEIKKLEGNSRFEKPEVFIFQTLQVDEPSSDEDIAKEIHAAFLQYLPWEIRRALGKYLVSIHTQDPPPKQPQESHKA